ncbi:MAG: hypothetical protein RBT76_15250 [candidate division Zixibacteria bacterium]|jgi:hypothetical protein|nr:hypothetical protein [candidate division Zixibacteria bacterium]
MDGERRALVSPAVATAGGCDIVTVRDLREVVAAKHIKTVCTAARDNRGRKPTERDLVLSLLMLQGHRPAIDPATALQRWTQLEIILKGA